jgi:hypothetical protein
MGEPDLFISFNNDEVRLSLNYLIRLRAFPEGIFSIR